MKWLCFVFLLANALVLVVIQFGGGSTPIDPRGREINASQVRVVTGQLASQTKDARASLPVAVPISQPASAAVVEPTPQTADKEPSQRTVCLRWSGISLERAPLARSRLKALGLTAIESGGAENAKVWVYVPPLDSQADARKKAQQIAELGVDDYFIVNDGKKWQNAISLGVFSTREAGERRLAELRDKGVRSAVLRDKEDTLKPVTFLLRNVSLENRKKLEKAGNQLRGAELKEVTCR